MRQPTVPTPAQRLMALMLDYGWSEEQLIDALANLLNDVGLLDSAIYELRLNHPKE